MSQSSRQSRKKTGIGADADKRAYADEKKDDVSQDKSPEHGVSGEIALTRIRYRLRIRGARVRKT